MFENKKGNMKKKILFLLALIIVAGVFFGYRFMYHDHRDVSTEEVTFSLSVKDMQHQFVENDSMANAKYADKTIAVYGKITNIDLPAHTITVDEKLSAVLKEKPSADLQLQQDIKLKGRFVGYDDLLEELKMDQVSIIK